MVPLFLCCSLPRRNEATQFLNIHLSFSRDIRCLRREVDSCERAAKFVRKEQINLSDRPRCYFIYSIDEVRFSPRDASVPGMTERNAMIMCRNIDFA